MAVSVNDQLKCCLKLSTWPLVFAALCLLLQGASIFSADLNVPYMALPLFYGAVVAACVTLVLFCEAFARCAELDNMLYTLGLLRSVNLTHPKVRGIARILAGTSRRQYVARLGFTLADPDGVTAKSLPLIRRTEKCEMHKFASKDWWKAVFTAAEIS